MWGKLLRQPVSCRDSIQALSNVYWRGCWKSFRKQFYFVVSGLKITGHGNRGSNLESPCMMFTQSDVLKSL
jgi:hypothetical protein